MAESRNKNFRAQFLFHTKIKTTYQNELPTTDFLKLSSGIKLISYSVLVVKILREKLVIFALEPKLDWATMTLILTSAPKFLWLVVHLDE